MLTVSSANSWRSGRRVTFVSRTADLPYPCWTSFAGICGSVLPDHVGQPEPGDLVDLLQRRGELSLPGILETMWERGQDRLLAIFAGADDEREPEPLPVRRVKPLER